MSSSGGRFRRSRPRGQLVVIEFIGTPGVGKTTLSNELVSLFQENKIDASTIVGAARGHALRTLAGQAVARFTPNSLRRASLWQLFYLLSTIQIAPFVLEHFRLTLFVLRTQLRRRIPMAARRNGLFWFFQLAGRCRFLRTTSRAREMLVVDDGFLHRSVNLNASHNEEPNPCQVAAYVDLAPRPDLVVFAVAGRDTCERRIRERGVWPHRRHLSHAELSRYVRNAELVVDMAVQRARERGWTVLEVDNTDRELRQVRRELWEAVGPVLSESSRRA
jgi:AAA domain